MSATGTTIIVADEAGKWRDAIGADTIAFLRDTQLAPTRGNGGLLHFMDRETRERCIAGGQMRQEDALDW